MNPSRKNRLIAVLLAGLAFAPAAPALVAPAQASEIKLVVNNVPVTSYDIQRRSALLKLMGRGKVSAREDMIEQTLRSVEMRRLGINITPQMVAAAYARFAKSNKLSAKQMDQVLAQRGVTGEHFREFIRVQIGWNQALGARARAEGGTSTRDAVRAMMEKDGRKPSATEYMLQQVIFVVPRSERGALLAKRKREAQALRDRFSGCDSTREFAKGLIDVTVRDLGRVLAPELPPDWAKPIKETRPGSATSVRETERGVEFIGICSTREVSDDRVAQLTFQAAGNPDEKADALSKKYLGELKAKARISER